MKNKQIRATGIVLLLLTFFALIAVCSISAIRVNAQYPKHNIIEYNLSDDVGLRVNTDPMPLHEETSYTISAISATLVKQEDFDTFFPGYDNPMLFSGKSNDMRVLLVELNATNASNNRVSLPIDSVCAQMGAWANGIELPIFSIINKNIDNAFWIEGNSSQTLYLPFCIYDVQFGYNDVWRDIDSRSFELVLETYPDKIYINLGSPAENSGLQFPLKDNS